MLDVFNEEAEILIKEGIASLYWFKPQLKSIWLKSGVPSNICEHIFSLKNNEGQLLTKRQMMDRLYEQAKKLPEAKRLEISRNFVRVLVSHKTFTPQCPEHKISTAEDAALQLKAIIDAQNQARQSRNEIQKRVAEQSKESYENKLMAVRNRFESASKLTGQARGYEFEGLFVDLMKASGIPVHEPFKIIGEQIDGAIQYGNRFYLIELKWVKDRCNQADISSLYLKVGGKLEALGIFIAMEGYSPEVLESLTHGKKLSVLLLDGVHISNVIYGNYHFNDLLDHALSYASLKGVIYCPHQIG